MKHKLSYRAKARSRKHHKTGIRNLKKELKDLENLEKALIGISKWQEGSVIRIASIGFISSLMNLTYYLPYYKDTINKKMKISIRELKRYSK